VTTSRWAIAFGLALLSASCASSPAADPSVAVTRAPSAVIQSSTAVTQDTATASSLSPPSSTATSPATEPAVVVVRTGSEVLAAAEFDQIAGMRVGLISHQNSVVGNDHLGDLLHAAPNVTLAAMFGPEHGARGDADAGEYVEDAIDAATGVPIFSLFGFTRKPTKDMLEGIDVLVYDLQDVGARYYTYISTMGLAMQAAARADVAFVVLDRPNPLGGQIGGGVLRDVNASFVGQYELPDVYGLTAGELALEIVRREALPGLENLQLSVVEMQGWDHSMVWQDTGLLWIPPSPAMTTPDAALLYPATIYFEATSLSYGRGTDQPFQVIAAPWLDAIALEGLLNGRALPGIDFRASSITPQMLPGMTVEPAFLGATIPAIELVVTDVHSLRATEVGVHLLDAVAQQAKEAGVEMLSRPDWMDQLSGSATLRRALEDGLTAEEILVLHARQQSRPRDVLEAAWIYD
jgi:uncharacterized protein YbbC (DUF1343 family)